MKFRFLVLLVCSSTLLFSCSNKLTREQAAQMIIDGKGYPQEEKCSFKNWYLAKSSKNKVKDLTWNNHKEDMLGLEEQGLVTIETRENVWVDAWGYTQIKETKHIFLTDTGKTYQRDTYNNNFSMKCRELVFGEVTGVSQDDDDGYAYVAYTVIRSNHTPFHYVCDYPPTEDTLKKHATFIKYDDGWRLSKD